MSAAAAESRPRRGRKLAALLGVGVGAGVSLLVVLLGTVAAIVGGDLGCLGGGSSGADQPAASRSAEAEIPPARLRIYQAAGRRFDIDWAFLASIGAQECNHGACGGVNSSGCAGPMQIGVGGACGNIWVTYKVDGDRDGDTDVNNPADAIFTAARILRQAKGAPPTGGSYAAYREAACGYYGACGDAVAAYADEVMARAVQYGFQGSGAPAPTDPEQAQPQLASSGGCGSAGTPAGQLGEARRATSPQGLRPLPADITPGTAESCDARVVPDVVYLARRYGILVTDCYGLGHAPDGEHPLGAAIDAVPKDGNWSRTLRLARALGWSESCAASGVAPSCADPPFRFIGYNNFPSHGDPSSCVPCTGGPHIHISWQTSASPGQPDNAARYGYTAPEWIDVLASPAGGSGDNAQEGRTRA
ncbi:hypothetical protein HJD18_16355 [Thermoleophilia bacterium SCSIO 60948]|nr:hypothetical protein HJD18_16355 [Thermoleophilia bacterium SCSIO 60948]